MMTVDDDCLSIIDTSRDRKERLDEALTRNGELEQLNSELQGIVDNGGLINRRSSTNIAGSKDFIENLMQQNCTLEAALIQEE